MKENNEKKKISNNNNIDADDDDDVEKSRIISKIFRIFIHDNNNKCLFSKSGKCAFWQNLYTILQLFINTKKQQECAFLSL